MNHPTPLEFLHSEVIRCERCPRLVEYRQRIGAEKRRAYLDCTYWARPVPGLETPTPAFSPSASPPELTAATAPAVPSPEMPPAISCTPSCTASASPPSLSPLASTMALPSTISGSPLPSAALRRQQPLPSELANCAEYTVRELAALPHVKVVVALGKFAFDAYLGSLRQRQIIGHKSRYTFAHAAEYAMPNSITLLASYHPSNQNTATGKLTASMFEAVFARAKELAG